MDDQTIMHMDEEKLLGRVKATSLNSMRPKLCQVFKNFGQVLPSPTIEWCHYAGMGESVLHPAAPVEVATAKRLLDKGQLVPTWEDSVSFYDRFTHLVHFDDVNWARADDGRMVIYDFVTWLPQPDAPDRVIDAAERPQALAHFNQMNGLSLYMDDTPVTLKGFGVVTPILTDKRQIALRNRQNQSLPVQRAG